MAKSIKYIEGDIISCQLDMEAGESHFFKNPKTYTLKISCGDLMISTSTPVTKEDIEEALSLIREFLENNIAEDET